MRPVVSMPTAWRLLPANGEIRTNLHAGGMTNDLIRSSEGSSVMGLPAESKYLKPPLRDPRRRHHFARRPFSTTAINDREDNSIRPSAINLPLFVKPSIAKRSQPKQPFELPAIKYCR